MLLDGDMTVGRLLEVSAERHIRTILPPIFLWHTMDDGSVPVENSILLMQALKKKGVPVEAHFFPTGRHGLSLATEATAFEDESDPAEFARKNRHVSTWITMAGEWIRSL
jgi:acetyl esterase/lipase